ncbi:MAG: hypothetical protein AB8I08_33055 [Sandaracinaceae bacterium]
MSTRVDGNPSPRGLSPADEDRLAKLMARGASASSGEVFTEEAVRSQVRKGAQTRREIAPLDPTTPHRLLEQQNRAAPPSAPLFEGILGAVPDPATVPMSAAEPDQRAVGAAVQSAQAGFRKGRDSKRRRRRAYDEERLKRVREKMFEGAGQLPDIPDLPALRPEVRGTNLLVMRDGDGRKALEVLSWLPFVQQMAVLELAYASTPFHLAGMPNAFTRSDFAMAPRLPEKVGELSAALTQLREDVVPSLWFRRLVASAWAMWSHRGTMLSEEAKKASRGGVFFVEGFTANALSWLVPRADKTSWSRSALWGPTGPFALLGAGARRLGREEPGEAGACLWVRWQQPVGRARFKGPSKTNMKTGKLERFAFGQTRYDAEMSGRTAMGLVRRGRGALRLLAETVLRALTPWVKLPKRRGGSGVRKRPSGRRHAPERPDHRPTRSEPRGPP